eukprot:TRINITY_DN7932_c0_g1_i1.p1 TRINITY_DN7932_c0_g1~~TRINITY_DN7932_c0_g1_i1.p1  ORF type:complete len:278 (-),score=22.04 TRINITY_DN7932_c0_g1_i1:83-916(-)
MGNRVGGNKKRKNSYNNRKYDTGHSTENSSYTSEPIFRVLVMGRPGCGKTTFISRFLPDRNVESLSYGDLILSSIHMHDTTVRLVIGELNGENYWNRPRRGKNFDIGIVCYDITCERSFMEAEDWMKKFVLFYSHNPMTCMAFIGLKRDLEDQRAITKEQLRERALMFQYDNPMFFETSSVEPTDHSVREAMMAVITRKLRLIGHYHIPEPLPVRSSLVEIVCCYIGSNIKCVEDLKSIRKVLPEDVFALIERRFDAVKLRQNKPYSSFEREEQTLV